MQALFFAFFDLPERDFLRPPPLRFVLKPYTCPSPLDGMYMRDLPLEAAFSAALKLLHFGWLGRIFHERL
jgi:hypothetical protein